MLAKDQRHQRPPTRCLRPTTSSAPRLKSAPSPKSSSMSLKSKLASAPPRPALKFDRAHPGHRRYSPSRPSSAPPAKPPSTPATRSSAPHHRRRRPRRASHQGRSEQARPHLHGLGQRFACSMPSTPEAFRLPTPQEPRPAYVVEVKCAYLCCQSLLLCAAGFVCPPKFAPTPGMPSPPETAKQGAVTDALAKGAFDVKVTPSTPKLPTKAYAMVHLDQEPSPATSPVPPPVRCSPPVTPRAATPATSRSTASPAPWLATSRHLRHRCSTPSLTTGTCAPAEGHGRPRLRHRRSQ